MTKSVQAVERACDLMLLIASKPSGLGVSEVAVELDLSKSAVHRLLTALSIKSIIQKNPFSQQYSLHPKVLELVLPFISQQEIYSVSRPFLEGLRDRFQETAVLAVREGFSCRMVAHAPSTHELRYSPTIGRELPLHWGAFGKAILADLPPEEFEVFLQEVSLAPATSNTVVNPTQLRKERQQNREHGYSQSIGEVIEGHVGIAASVRGQRGSPVASIGLGGPESRVQRVDISEMGQEGREAAQHISNIMRLQTL